MRTLEAKEKVHIHKYEKWSYLRLLEKANDLHVAYEHPIPRKEWFTKRISWEHTHISYSKLQGLKHFMHGKNQEFYVGWNGNSSTKIDE